MRLWHIDIIPYLPDYQLSEQWKELDLIFRKQPKDILINYIYDYPKEYLLCYSNAVMKELYKRHIMIHDFKNYVKYFKDVVIKESDKFRYLQHNDKYFKLCFSLLYECYIRGQKDYSEDKMEALVDEMIKRNLI
jgi:uncharacterized protein (TIGR02328 family)|nr:MAG TPA: Pyrimidine dimer DNA glycosylase [Caudoviricetes sp.]